MNIQSNSLRGSYMKEIVDKTIDEIYHDIKGMFGPGATDAFIVKDGAPYYTRDGKEVMESLIFDNELSMYVHHILYQAVYNQGKMVGDGSTTLALFYCHLYNAMRNNEARNANLPLGKYFATMSLNEIRYAWKRTISEILRKLEERVVPMTRDLLPEMIYTCTQDDELTDKICTNLGGPIMEGAYILPRKSNIATDFSMTVYDRPTFHVTRQFSILPVGIDIMNAVVLYCNGMLDIAHWEIFMAMMGTRLLTGGYEDGSTAHVDNTTPVTFIILAHGVTNTTRDTIRTFNEELKKGHTFDRASNVAIYTLDDYRSFGPEEFEDIATLITDEPGLGGIVHALTYEILLYRTFNVASSVRMIDELETFDFDLHLIDQLSSVITKPHEVIFDEIKGMSICKELGPYSKQRYDELRKEIDEEKSSVRKADLVKRMRRIYGKFIDIEVGSTLLKDSQRKFELVFDAILSSADAVEKGVLKGNSLLHLYQVIDEMFHDNKWSAGEADILSLINHAARETFIDLYFNIHPEIEDTPSSREEFRNTEMLTLTPDEFNQQIIEPFGIIEAILKNSVLPIELAKTEVFHISGKTGFMSNYIE